MSHVLNRSTVALTALAVAAGGALMSAPAQAAPSHTTQVRPGDLIASTSGVNAGGKMEFLAQGVHLRVPDPAADFARGHFKTSVPLSQVHEIDYTWFGTDNKPGVYYDIDIDGDGNADGELIGESFYGPTDLWLNKDVQDMPGTHTQPNGTFAGLAPCDNGTQRTGATDTCTPPNGAGAQFHGTINDWNRRITLAGKTANIVAGGFVASGLKQDGVLTQITYGPEQFVLTDLAKAKATVDASAKRAQIFKGQKARIRGHVEPAGSGAKVTLEAKIKGKWTTLKTRALAANGNFKFGDKPAKLGVNRYRVEVTETNATMSAKSKTVKVRVVRHHHR